MTRFTAQDFNTTEARRDRIKMIRRELFDSIERVQSYALYNLTNEVYEFVIIKCDELKGAVEFNLICFEDLLTQFWRKKTTWEAIEARVARCLTSYYGAIDKNVQILNECVAIDNGLEQLKQAFGEQSAPKVAPKPSADFTAKREVFEDNAEAIRKSNKTLDDLLSMLTSR